MTAMIEALLAQARHYQQSNDARAEKAFLLVLENDAFNVEARTFLARVAMQARQPQQALEHLQIATQANPNNASLWRSLGIAHYALEQWPQAQSAFEQCLEIAPKMHAARLHLGKTLERQGQQSAATKTYLAALSQAQREGLWLGAASTPPWLLKDIQHASDVANRGRQDLYDTLMQPLLERFGKSELQRVALSVKGVLGFEQFIKADAKQRPTFMFFPGLPETPVFDRSLFSWFEQLENNYEAIRLEAINVLQERNGVSPFLALGEGDKVSDYLGGQQPNWDAYFFYRHGEKFEQNHRACPHTSAALESLPLVRIDQHAPEICFSILAPDTHILPHYGTSNIRSVVHLPLVVPKHCALKVQDQVIEGFAGRCFAFDDTFLHEAWNRSDDVRVILLMDTWNPHLSEIEKYCLAELVVGIGQFNHE
jgi:aspartate beta-hydroxylase